MPLAIMLNYVFNSACGNIRVPLMSHEQIAIHKIIFYFRQSLSSLGNAFNFLLYVVRNNMHEISILYLNILVNALVLLYVNSTFSFSKVHCRS